MSVLVGDPYMLLLIPIAVILYAIHRIWGGRSCQISPAPGSGLAASELHGERYHRRRGCPRGTPYRANSMGRPAHDPYHRQTLPHLVAHLGTLRG